MVLMVMALAMALLPAPGAHSARPAAAVEAATDALRPSTEPEPPIFPESYTVRYTFSLPYTAKLQPEGIRYPVAFYRDAEGKRTRMDTYDSTTVMITKKDSTFELVPRIDRQNCLASRSGPTAAAGAGNSLDLMSALPDVTGWEFAGEEALAGSATHVWQYTARHAAKTVVYRLHVSADGAATPLRLHMQGREMFSGSHFDEYVVEYSEFSPGRPDASLFKTPDLCKGVAALTVPAGQRTASQLRMAGLVPAVAYRGGHAEYDAFLASHGAARRHASLAEYRRRAALFQGNAALVEVHNVRNASYTMAMNRFGDWSREEFVQLMLPRRARLQRQAAAAASAGSAAASAGGSAAAAAPASSDPSSAALAGGKQHKLRRHELPYAPLVDPAGVPAELSWRGTGGDGLGPMDQATCGSCWAFSAAEAMEGAWWRATGQKVSFSEQQIVDCSWGFVPGDPGSNLGCEGGNHWAAVGHIVDAGGIALTTDYPYKGQDAYCAANTTRRVGKFKGYARVPRYDVAAHREALFSRGPLAISLDASQASFAFYSSGVYREPACEYTPDGLDHDVLLVGYGSSPEGDYWLVKNSWSDHWGDGGYIKIAVDDGACGVTTDTIYAVVDEAALRASAAA